MLPVTGDPVPMPQFFSIFVAIRNRDLEGISTRSSSSPQIVLSRCLGSGTAFVGLGMVKTRAQHSHCVKDDVFSGKNCDEPTAAHSPSCRHVTAVTDGPGVDRGEMR